MDLSTNNTAKKFIMPLNMILFTTLILAITPAQAADSYYVPSFCEPSDLTLVFFNKTKKTQRFWIQRHLDNEIQENFYEINPSAPNNPLLVHGSDVSTEKKAFSIKTLENNALEILARCQDHQDIPLSAATSALVQHPLPSSVSSVTVHLLNLFLNSNKIQLLALNNMGIEVARMDVVLEKYYDTQNIKWALPKEVRTIKVHGEQRLHSLVLYKNENQEQHSPGLPGIVLMTPDTQKKYFLVSTKDRKPEEAFVIALDEEEKIESARQQIQNPQLEKIVVARITLGHGGFNRAFFAKDKSPYSWSTSQVDAFTDFSHIDCDGSPNITEERLLQKLNEGGRICFWRYRVIKELSPDEVARGKIHGP